MVVKTNGIPFWLVGEFTTKILEPILVGIGMPWGYGLLTHGQILGPRRFADFWGPTGQFSCVFVLAD